jgi:hypothetical protein
VYHQKEGDPELKIVGRWAWLGERFSPANGAIGTTQDPGDVSVCQSGARLRQAYGAAGSRPTCP